MEKEAGLSQKTGIQLEFNPVIADQPLILRQPPQLFPDNLPALADNSFAKTPDQTRDIEKASRDIEKASKMALSFLEEFVETSTIKGENKTLNRINSASFKSTQQTQEQIAILKQIKKDGGKNKVECYLKGKRSLKRIHTLSIKTSGIISWVDDLVDRNIESMNQTANLEKDFQKPEDRSLLKGIIKRHLPVQMLKTKAYVGQINLLTQDRLALSLLGSDISIFLQQKLEPAIYTEYYNKALAVNSIVTQPPFDKIFAEIMAVIESQQSSDNPENSSSETSQTSQPLTPEKILAFHKFDIEEPTQYPDYQITCHYLTQINNYIDGCFSSQNETYLSLFNGPDNFEKTFDLAQKLLTNIRPELRAKWSTVLDRFTNIKILITEQEVWRQKFGNDNIKMPSISKLITPELLKNATELEFGLFITPDLREYIKEEDIKRLSIEEFLNNIKKQLPGWENTNALFWKYIKNSEGQFPDVSGHCLLVENMVRKKYNDKYSPSKITKILGLEDRFNITCWDDANEAIIKSKADILSAVRLCNMEVRMLEALEVTLLLNREDCVRYHLYEHTNTIHPSNYRQAPPFQHIIMGPSKKEEYSSMTQAMYSSRRIGFHLAIVLS